jgi:pimeloyl-ACP methyl ester carboxylesterase
VADVTEYNADGKRTLTIINGNFPKEYIVQIASHITPKYVYVGSGSHKLRQVYSTAELGPVVVRGLLANHPDLRDGWLAVPDPLKRIKIAEFMLAAGWRAEARAELAKLKKDAPWAWAKEASDKFDKVSAAIDADEVKWVVGELKVALAAGQYQLAERVLKQYQPKGAGADDLKALAELKARVEQTQPRYEAARRHLRELIDELTGADRQHAAAAVGGGPMKLAFPGKAVPAEYKAIVPGAEAVLAELHPDALARLETFADVAGQMARERAAGRQPKATPQQALALAVSGWLLGKNGAVNEPAMAAKIWNTRVMLTAYLNNPKLNDRVGILKDYQKSTDQLGPDEIAQIVSLLPPIDPENLADRRGKPVPEKECGAPDTYRIESGPLPDDRDGVTYYLRLPREYHHGRSYPLVVAIHDPGMDAAKMIGRLAAECDRNGYILIAPEWASQFGNKHFDYGGSDHHLMTSAIRDLSRKFSVDQDRVFAYGFGEGGTFALDLAMSRPDYFAGVVSMGAAPVYQFYRDYARNAQKVAVYSVTGELAQASVDGLRQLYQNWLPYGYYAILSVYKGRGAEWYAGEVPTTFDWMNRKKRVRGLESLRMDGGRFDAWHTLRPGDDRFYWVGASELQPGNTLTAKKAERPDNPPPAARFAADIVDGKRIVVKDVYGVKKITLWLERGMIAWGTKVEFAIDSGFDRVRPVVVEPDLPLMLEELYRTGDRKMLFFAKFEFKL